jgi:hypothetical protein
MKLYWRASYKRAVPLIVGLPGANKLPQPTSEQEQEVRLCLARVYTHKCTQKV